MSASWPNEGQLTTARCPGPHPLSSAAPALRRAAARIPVDVAVEDCAAWRTGVGDLLAEPAGQVIDATSVQPVTAEYRAAVRLLIAASAGEDRLQAGSEMIGSVD